MSIRLEQKLLYWLLRREVKRMSISHFKSWLTWFNLDLTLKEKGLEEW